MKCRQTSLSIMGALFSRQKIMEQLRLDDLRTGDRIRITTANSTYEILVVASEARLGELCGGQIDSPQLVTLTGNPAHARHERAAIDVGHEFQFATTTPHHRRREAAIRVIATSAVVSIGITPRTCTPARTLAVSTCRRLRLIAAVTIRRWWNRARETST